MAVVKDYLDYAFLKICKPESPEVKHSKLKNKDEIADKLIEKYFKPRCRSLCLNFARSTKYFSLIRQRGESTRYLLQHFSLKHGIQHSAYVKEPGGCIIMEFAQTGLSNRMVGYCGDFMDLTVPTSDRVTNQFNIFPPFRRIRNYLPYRDNMRENMLELAASYLNPINIIYALHELGKYFLKQKQFEPTASAIEQLYKNALDSKTYILESPYCKFVVRCFESIRDLLLNCEFFPQTVSELFNNHKCEFYLNFFVSINALVGKKEFSENSAVMYYQYVRQLISTFELYKSEIFVSPDCAPLFRELWDSDLVKNILSTYGRIIQYLQHILNTFPDHFTSFEWVLLENHTIDYDKFHVCYHLIFDRPCADQCTVIASSVHAVNNLLTDLVPTNFRSQHTLDKYWVQLFLLIDERKVECAEIKEMVTYLLSLPCTVYKNTINLNEDVVERVYSKLYTVDSFVQKKEKIFEDEWGDIHETIKEILLPDENS